MTLRGTAPQSTSVATRALNWSSAIICRVPPMLARRASMGLMARTPTQHNNARIKAGRADGDKSFDMGNIV